MNYFVPYLNIYAHGGSNFTLRMLLKLQPGFKPVQRNYTLSPVGSTINSPYKLKFLVKADPAYTGNEIVDLEIPFTGRSDENVKVVIEVYSLEHKSDYLLAEHPKFKLFTQQPILELKEIISEIENLRRERSEVDRTNFREEDIPRIEGEFVTRPLPPEFNENAPQTDYPIGYKLIASTSCFYQGVDPHREDPSTGGIN